MGVNHTRYSRLMSHTTEFGPSSCGLSGCDEYYTKAMEIELTGPFTAEDRLSFTTLGARWPHTSPLAGASISDAGERKMCFRTGP